MGKTYLVLVLMLVVIHANQHIILHKEVQYILNRKGISIEERVEDLTVFAGLDVLILNQVKRLMELKKYDKNNPRYDQLVFALDSYVTYRKHDKKNIKERFKEIVEVLIKLHHARIVLGLVYKEPKVKHPI
uniref:Uncharacterized protein n=1 Tax=Clastoptera arizonana TaxID=38151 RepID=A0A1B6CEG6_9HEMI